MPINNFDRQLIEPPDVNLVAINQEANTDNLSNQNTKNTINNLFNTDNRWWIGSQVGPQVASQVGHQVASQVAPQVASQLGSQAAPQFCTSNTARQVYDISTTVSTNK